MDEPSPRPARRRAARIIGTGLIASTIGLAILVASEAWARNGDTCFRSVMVHDPSVGWKLKPGTDASVFYRWSTDSVDFRFNGEGFRDRDHPFAKPAGTERILVLGDSYTAGLEVPSADLFTTRLAQRLSRGTGGVRREVMNVAIPAWSTDQQWIEFRERALAYAPDFVAIMIAPNDVRESTGKGFFRLEGDRLVERTDYPVPLYGRTAWALSNRSCAFQRLQNRLDLRHGTAAKMFEYYPVSFRVGNGGASDPHVFLRERPEEMADAYRLFDTLVLEIVNACRSAGCRPLLAVIPTKMEFDGTLDPDVHQAGYVAAHVQKLSESNGIDYVDLFGPLLGEEDPLRLFIDEEYHLTPEGHAYVADRLAAWFEGV